MRGLEQIPWLYDLTASLGDAFGVGRWRDLLIQGAEGRVLEVGVGTGRNLPRYRTPHTVVGSDIELRTLLRARRRHPGTHLIVASVDALPFPNHTFDTAVSSLVFCSVPRPVHGLCEIARVLTPAGSLRMMEHVRHTRHWRARIQDWIQPGWTRFTGGCHPNRDTERSLQLAGYRIEASTRRAKGAMRLLTARPRDA